MCCFSFAQLLLTDVNLLLTSGLGAADRSCLGAGSYDPQTSFHNSTCFCIEIEQGPLILGTNADSVC